MNNDIEKNQENPLEKAHFYAGCLEEKQASDILGLDLQGLSSTSEAMLVATARNVRHSQALADALMKCASERKDEVLGIEGYKTGQWVLVDMNDVVVHIFQRDVRGYFNLEGLWAQAPVFFQPEDSASGLSPSPDSNASEDESHYMDEDEEGDVS